MARVANNMVDPNDVSHHLREAWQRAEKCGDVYGYFERQNRFLYAARTALKFWSIPVISILCLAILSIPRVGRYLKQPAGFGTAIVLLVILAAILVPMVLLYLSGRKYSLVMSFSSDVQQLRWFTGADAVEFNANAVDAAQAAMIRLAVRVQLLQLIGEGRYAEKVKEEMMQAYRLLVKFGLIPEPADPAKPGMKPFFNASRSNVQARLLELGQLAGSLAARHRVECYIGEILRVNK